MLFVALEMAFVFMFFYLGWKLMNEWADANLLAMLKDEEVDIDDIIEKFYEYDSPKVHDFIFLRLASAREEWITMGTITEA